MYWDDITSIRACGEAADQLLANSLLQLTTDIYMVPQDMSGQKGCMFLMGTCSAIKGRFTK